MTQQTSVLPTNGAAPDGVAGTVVPATRTPPGAGPPPASAVRTMRVLTANVQSVPRSAISLAQAREDLRANAADGDLVMLQEIDGRYRRIVGEEFPSAHWHVFFGRTDNHSPIAARKDIFDLLDEDVILIHPARAGLHGRRYLTHVHLRHRELGLDLHATNVHLTPGAFSTPPPADVVTRQLEWIEGMRRHDRFVEGLIATGEPVLGAGDYNRPLRGFKAQADSLAGRPVRFGVDTASIDLLWFVDGVTAAWTEHGRAIFRGRDGRPRRRNSDHAARQTTLALTKVAVEGGTDHGPATVVVPGAAVPKKGRKKHKPRANALDAGPVAQALTATGQLALPFAGPADRPFETTEFGEGKPKLVDWKTRAALEEVERRLGYRLTVVQGCYNNGRVKASGPTHDGGGVVDLLAWDWRRKVRELRAVGFAAWHRTAVPGLWGEHIHAVLIEHGRLDPSAARQVLAYRAGLDGLKSGRDDDFPRPRPIPVFTYPPAPTVPATLAGGDGRSDQGPEPLGRPFPPRRLDGVDISHHQPGRFDLTAAKRAGLRWWYVKATEGTTFTDKTYRKRVRQGRAAGIPTGAYHFARPGRGDAEAEARFFLRAIELRAGDMVPMLDLEDTGDLNLHQLTQWTGTWVRTVTQELRHKGLAGKPVIYTPFNLESGFGCLLWVARYSDDFRAPVIPRPWRRAAIWQHSNGRFGPIKNVPGIGRVDVNALHPDLPLAALRLRPVGRPSRSGPSRPDRDRGRGRGRDDRRSPRRLEALQEVTSPQAVATAQDTLAGTVVQPLTATTSPTVTTTTSTASATAPGSIVITVTVPMPATPAPSMVMPDLGPLEEQLVLAAKGIQGAIDSLPERTEP